MTLNPVTLKELRQFMRTPLIWFILMGYPAVLFILFGFAVNAGMHDAKVNDIFVGEGLGKNPFTITSMVTGATAVIVLPFVASIKATLECVKDRRGMEFTTTLTPAQLVNGKFMSTAILAATLVAVSMPFFALTYLMRGVQLASVFAAPMLLLLFSLVQTLIGLSIATLSMLHVTLRFFGLAVAFFADSVLFMSILEDIAQPYSEYTLVGVAITLLIVVSALVLFSRMAAAHISPPFVDSERPLRKAILALLAPMLPVLFSKDWWGVWIADGGLVCLLLLVRSCLLFRPMPRTLKARAPKSVLGRLVSFPFTTGAYTGPLFAMVMFALVMPPGYFLCHDRDWTILAIFLAEVTALFLAGIGCLSWFRSPRAPLIFLISLGGWIFFANISEIVLVWTGALSRGFVNMLIGNLNGIDHHPIRHLCLAGALWVPGILLFLPKLIREFRSYRRP